jgi:hypothetical protein
MQTWEPIRIGIIVMSEHLIPSNETDRVLAYTSSLPCSELLEIALALFHDSL